MPCFSGFTGWAKSSQHLNNESFLEHFQETNEKASFGQILLLYRDIVEVENTNRKLVKASKNKMEHIQEHLSNIHGHGCTHYICAKTQIQIPVFISIK